jgi:hypothetical protein
MNDPSNICAGWSLWVFRNYSKSYVTQIDIRIRVILFVGRNIEFYSVGYHRYNHYHLKHYENTVLIGGSIEIVFSFVMFSVVFISHLHLLHHHNFSVILSIFLKWNSWRQNAIRRRAWTSKKSLKIPKG